MLCARCAVDRYDKTTVNRDGLALKKWWFVGIAVGLASCLSWHSADAAPSLSEPERQAIAAAMGSRTAVQYCSGSELKSGMEKAMVQTIVAMDLDLSALDQIDLETKAIGIAFFENLFADAFASCPGRARALWRQILEM